MEQSPATVPGNTDKRIAALLEQLTPLVNKVVEARAYYLKRAARPRMAFRVSGVAVILLSLSIPIGAKQEADASTGAANIIAATQQLIESARKVTSAETEEFFSKIEWPAQKK